MFPGSTSVHPAGTVPLAPVIAPLLIARAETADDVPVVTAGVESRSRMLVRNTLIVTVSWSWSAPPVPVLAQVVRREGQRGGARRARGIGHSVQGRIYLCLGAAERHRSISRAVASREGQAGRSRQRQCAAGHRQGDLHVGCVRVRRH